MKLHFRKMSKYTYMSPIFQIKKLGLFIFNIILRKTQLNRFIYRTKKKDSGIRINNKFKFIKLCVFVVKATQILRVVKRIK